MYCFALCVCVCLCLMCSVVTSQHLLSPPPSTPLDRTHGCSSFYGDSPQLQHGKIQQSSNGLVMPPNHSGHYWTFIDNSHFSMALTPNRRPPLCLTVSFSFHLSPRQAGAPGAPMMQMARPSFPSTGATPGAPVTHSLWNGLHSQFHTYRLRPLRQKGVQVLNCVCRCLPGRPRAPGSHHHRGTPWTTSTLRTSCRRTDLESPQGMEKKTNYKAAT